MNLFTHKLRATKLQKIFVSEDTIKIKDKPYTQINILRQSIPRLFGTETDKLHFAFIRKKI